MTELLPPVKFHSLQ
jgi:cytochrome b involved in lipid metabolism